MEAAVAFRDRLTFTTTVRECRQNWPCGKALIYSHFIHYNIFRPQISHSTSQIGYISLFLTASDKISLKDSNPLHAKPVIYIYQDTLKENLHINLKKSPVSYSSYKNGYMDFIILAAFY